METLRFEKVTCVIIRIGKKSYIFLLLERSTAGELQIVIFLTSFNLSGAS